MFKRLYAGLAREKSYFFQEQDYFSNIYAQPLHTWLTAICGKA